MIIPCKDCITLAVCKAIASNSHKDKPFVTKLYDKCSLIKDYLSFAQITRENELVINTLNIEKTRCEAIESFFDNKDRVTY